MDKDLKIEDFENIIYPILKANYELFEVSKIAEHTMNRGRVYLPESEVKFKPLTLDCYAMQVFERLRGVSTPQLKKTKLGKLLVWDNYALKLK